MIQALRIIVIMSPAGADLVTVFVFPLTYKQTKDLL